MIEIFRKIRHRLWLQRRSKQQKLLHKYFFIMNNNINYFNKPCEKCKCYVEANDVVLNFYDKSKILEGII